MNILNVFTPSELVGYFSFMAIIIVVAIMNNKRCMRKIKRFGLYTAIIALSLFCLMFEVIYSPLAKMRKDLTKQLKKQSRSRDNML